MARETVGDNCLLRTAGKKPSCPQVFSNSDLLSHDSQHCRAEDSGKHFSSSSQNPERNCFPSLMVVSPSVIFYLAREKNQGVQGRKGPYFGKKWAQVGTLWGKRIQNRHIWRIASKESPIYILNFSPSDLQPTLAVLFYVMGNPPTLQLRGAGEVAVCVFWRFLNLKYTISSYAEDVLWLKVEVEKCLHGRQSSVYSCLSIP